MLSTTAKLQVPHHSRPRWPEDDGRKLRHIHHYTLGVSLRALQRDAFVIFGFDIL